MAQYQSGYNETPNEQYFETITWEYSRNYATGSKVAQQKDGIPQHSLGTSNSREPSLVTGTDNYTWIYQSSNNTYDSVSQYYKDICGFSSPTEFGQYMNEQYTNMIKSVKEYGGFYIGRYETSLKTGVVGSKINETPMSTETSSDAGNLWYGVYNKQDSLKNIHNPYYNSTTVVSSMIWNAQYDAMLNWALTGDEANNVFDKIGNHSGAKAKTGRWGEDIMNNIFDLGGNMIESSQGAIYSHSRNLRGGSSWSNSSKRMYSNSSQDPNSGANNLGSRLTLYMRSSEP